MKDRDIYTLRQTNRLKCKITAKNQVNALANELHPRIIAAFEPFKGKKIGLVGGTLTKEARAILAKVCNPADWYVGNVNYSFWVHVRFHASWGDGITGASHMEQEGIPIGEMHKDGHILKELYPPVTTRRTDFTALEVLQARRELKDAQEIVRACENKLCGFGEHEN